MGNRCRYDFPNAGSSLIDFMRCSIHVAALPIPAVPMPRPSIESAASAKTASWNALVRAGSGFGRVSAPNASPARAGGAGAGAARAITSAAHAGRAAPQENDFHVRVVTL